MASGFLSRWSRRKTLARQASQPASGERRSSERGSSQQRSSQQRSSERRFSEPGTSEPACNVLFPETLGGTALLPAGASGAAADAAAAAGAGGASAVAGGVASRVNSPGLDAANRLQGLVSDYRPFLSAGVDETVKRVALKKLFADPHFNVMDGLDVYVDDYSSPEALPAAAALASNGLRFMRTAGGDAAEDDAEEKAAQRGNAPTLCEEPAATPRPELPLACGMPQECGDAAAAAAQEHDEAATAQEHDEAATAQEHGEAATAQEHGEAAHTQPDQSRTGARAHEQAGEDGQAL